MTFGYLLLEEAYSGGGQLGGYFFALDFGYGEKIDFGYGEKMKDRK